MPANTFADKYGPWCIVAGSCQGIGRACAEEAAARGLNIVLVDNRADLLPGVAADLGDRHHVDTRMAHIDLAGDDTAGRIEQAMADLDVGLGIYCAARSLVGAFLDRDLDDHAAALRVNCAGAQTLAHVLGRRLRRRGRGGLILVSSMAGFQGTGWVASYAATKAFDRILAEGLWWELGQAGVDVLALAPGMTDTEGLRSDNPRMDPNGLQTAAEVAAEALDALGTTPVHICGADNRQTQKSLGDLPLPELLQVMGASTKSLYED